MPSLSQVLNALNSHDKKTRELASSILLNEFTKNPGDLPQKVVTFIAKRLGDSSERVKYQIAHFLYNYAKSGRSLGSAWLYLTRYLRTEDTYVRNFIIETFRFLDPKAEEEILKPILDRDYNIKFKELVAEALTHAYIRKGYLSSVESLLENKQILTAVSKAINENKARNLLKEDDYKSLMSKVYTKRYENLKPRGRRLPERRVRNRFA